MYIYIFIYIRAYMHINAPILALNLLSPKFFLKILQILQDDIIIMVRAINDIP